MARSARRQLVSDELVEHAGRLFLEQGYSRTSLQDIADSMGVSRPALYHYVDSKEELLTTLVHDVSQRVVEILERALARTDLAADARVESALHEVVVNTALQRTRFRLLDRSETNLPPDVAAVHRDARRRVLELMTAMLQAGIDDGVLRPVPARTTALALLGMANWVAWWYRPERDGEPGPLADVLVSVAMGGVRQAEGRRAAPGPAGALALIREDLVRLERAVQEAGRGPA